MHGLYSANNATRGFRRAFRDIMLYARRAIIIIYYVSVKGEKRLSGGVFGFPQSRDWNIAPSTGNEEAIIIFACCCADARTCRAR